MSMTFAKNV